MNLRSHISLNKKSKYNLTEVLDKFVDNSFDERDVRELFRNLRPFCKNNSLIWELASFVAHTEDRTRGFVHDKMNKCYVSLLYNNIVKTSVTKSINSLEMDTKLFNVIVGNLLESVEEAEYSRWAQVSKKDAKRILKQGYTSYGKRCLINNPKDVNKMNRLINALFMHLDISGSLNVEELMNELYCVLQHVNNLLESSYDIREIMSRIKNDFINLSSIFNYKIINQLLIIKLSNYLVIKMDFANLKV